MLKDPLMTQSKLLYTKSNIHRTFAQFHIESMTFKNGKHNSVLCTWLFSLCKCEVTNENNRSYLNNDGYIGENNRVDF